MASLEVLLEELSFHQENNEQLKTIKEEINKTNARISEMEERLEKNKDRTLNTEEVFTRLLKLHMKLDEKLTDVENQSRLENVRIYGVPEGSKKDTESMTTFLETLLKEGHGLVDNTADVWIERAHWA